MTPAAPAGPDDATRLAELHASSFDRPWTAAEFEALLTDPGGFALCAGDEGFVLLRRVSDEAEVLTLAVRPAARRSGHARALVQAAAARLARDGVAELHLEVAADNAAALALYASCGFEPAGVRRGYYARGTGAAAVDAVTLTRRLNTPTA